MKIMILDDDEDLIDALRQILSNRDFDVDTATNAKDAIELLKDTTYDLVMLDYAMPDHDGIWFMNHSGIARHTKVLLITGHIERRMISHMFNLGACGYMIKPFDEDELIRNLNFFLQNDVSA